MRVLITGATGLIGTEVVRHFNERGVRVNYLTTSKDKIENLDHYRGFYWNPENDQLDARSLDGVGAIVHLAGENIFTPWTARNKRKITSSRIDSAALLYKTLQENEHSVGHFVSASGISIYPSSYKKMYYEEEQELSNSFLGELVQKWEAAADRFNSLDIRVAKIRTGIVLSEKGGALPQMKKPVKMGLGAPLGSGKQWQSWIHIEDLARIYAFVVSNGLVGIFNAVAPDPVTNQELMAEIAKVEQKRMILPKVPAFAIKLVMGEMAETALESQLVASKKIQEAGFSFDHVNMEKTLRELQE